VVLVGRPNVGKSTLFNRITGSRRAIVAPAAGTTRDSLARPAVWRGTTFELFDTGGMFGASEDPLHELVIRQGQRAMSGADLLVFVVDGREGLVSGDERIAEDLRRTNRPVVVAINKTDDKRAQASSMEFFQLGFDPVVEISAEHGHGVAELLDEIVKVLGTRRSGPGTGASTTESKSSLESRAPGPESRAPSPESRAPSPESLAPSPQPPIPDETGVAIVGRPNVGKSSLVNRLLREERVLVSEMPGTTRDAIDTVLMWHRRRFRIVDTAGMRKPGSVGRGGIVEVVSVAGAKKAIFDADVVALVIDASTGATEQDAAIGGEADRAGRGVVILANKWDLVKDRGADYVTVFDEETRHRMRFLDYAPILHISAATGERTAKVLETMDRIAAVRRQRIPTPALNKFLEGVTAANPPVSPGKKHVRILYAAQIGIMPPSFVLFTNVATTFHFSYERFLINKLREQFGFIGTPIRIQVRRRAKGGGPRKASKGRTDRKRSEARTIRDDRKDRAARRDRKKD
jgi:GTP-binding protein